MIETVLSREASVKQGLSCRRVPTVTASSRQQSSTTRMLDDFFPPLLSLANARANWPPTKRYKSVRYLSIYFIYLLKWLQEYFTTSWFYLSFTSWFYLLPWHCWLGARKGTRSAMPPCVVLLVQDYGYLFIYSFKVLHTPSGNLG